MTRLSSGWAVSSPTRNSVARTPSLSWNGGIASRSTAGCPDSTLKAWVPVGSVWISRNTDDSLNVFSSICPHLGCSVSFRQEKQDYFCPCHTGTFAPDGVRTGGPPGDAGQTLPRYELLVDRGLLFIEVEVDQLASAGGEIVDKEDEIRGAGHDPCLAGRGTGGRRA